MNQILFWKNQNKDDEGNIIGVTEYGPCSACEEAQVHVDYGVTIITNGSTTTYYCDHCNQDITPVEE